MKLFFCVILVLLVLLAHGNGLFGDLVSDDVGYRDWTPNLAECGVNLRTLFSYVTLKIFGISDPLWLHLPNLIFHMGCVVLLFYVLGAGYPGLMGAAIFAVHPLTTESVAWISGGPYVYAGFFMLLSLWAFKRFLWASLLFYIIAVLMCSEKAAIFPLILLVWVCFNRDRYTRLIPFFLFMGLMAYWALAFRMPERLANLEYAYQVRPRSVSAFTLLPISTTRYIELFVWPEKLTFYHTNMVLTYQEYWSRAGILLLILANMAYLFIDNQRKELFWLLVFFISLIPVLLPFGLSWVVAERYVYFGTICLSAVAGMVLSKAGKTGIFIFLVIMTALTTQTWFRNREWRHEFFLWRATEKYSNSSMLHRNLGEMYSRFGNYPKAENHLVKSLKMRPSPEAYHNLAVVYNRQGRTADAKQLLQRAFQLNPNYLKGVYRERHN
ncbi:MAG TPA: hypothetical protein DCL42_10395 [Deltaproteobacteria bacterium]|nr:hypothetical protein [Deltaproteobacteria bacterium]